MILPSKSTLRKLMREQRAKLSQTDIQAKSVQIAEKILKLPAFQSSREIACYWALPAEISCQPIIDSLLATRGYCYLPVIDRVTPGEMEFFRYDSNTPLTANRFGILEPSLANIDQQPVHHSVIDFILLPVLAFDRKNYRLGNGGGYYDRYLAAYNNKKPFLCGLSYSFQAVITLKIDEWDIKLNQVVTD